MFGGRDVHDGRVVALTGGIRKMPPSQFARLRGYWEALRDGDALPTRAALDPRGFADLLECTLLVERIAPGMARIRLAGMGLCDLMGMDLRGMPLSALILPESRDPLRTQLEQVFAGPRIATFAMEAARGIGRPALSAQLLLLPLAGHDGTIDRALGCLVTEGKVGRVPRRFALAQSDLSEVPGYVAAAATTGRPAARAAAADTPEFTGLSLPRAPQPGFAAPKTPYDPTPKPRVNLRLIKGGI
jgi:hypothetical protein